jgi:hypothetical protein
VDLSTGIVVPPLIGTCFFRSRNAVTFARYERGPRLCLKEVKRAFRLLTQLQDLHVFGSQQIWLATPELFVAARRRYAAQACPLCASDVSQLF